MNTVRHSIVRLLAAVALAACTGAAAAELPQIPLAIGTYKLTAEVAATDAQRSTGLMHRRMLPENRGMLFVFPDVTLHGMWMMNTYLPLSVAFLDREGVIINIEDMTPHTQNTHSAARPAKYALEMNQGWFAKRGIKPGQRVEGLEKAGLGR
ncbi:MAG TPA: DUF192 domain-containing protein [Burkholderiales bacterium]|nr:DUF192 domain-containing protein [Burkholderiales bacterium]